MNELTKLLLIIVPGILILVIGFIIIKKKKDIHFDSMNSYSGETTTTASFSPNMSSDEEKAKNYIIQYKDAYPRESLKVSLVNSGSAENDVESWLDKYM
jgi:hypothetical protein